MRSRPDSSFSWLHDRALIFDNATRKLTVRQLSRADAEQLPVDKVGDSFTVMLSEEARQTSLTSMIELLI